MKKREIFLDFTSLLDVIMIILFFFILFSTFEIDEATKAANQTKAEYETKVDEAEAVLAEYQKEKDRLLSIDKNAVKNQEALLQYQGQILTINLYNKFDDDTLYINIKKGENKLDEFIYTESVDMKTKLTDTIKMTEFTNDDVIICNLTYNGDDLYSANAVKKIEKSVNDLQKEYENFYFAAINISK